jgi:peptide/nickel transport system ATP-binding protein
LADPEHPYTRALMAAVPSIDPDEPLRDIVGGEVSNPANPPSGCRFHPRCPLRRELGEPPVCHEAEPPLALVGPDHRSACHFNRTVEQTSIGRTASLEGKAGSPSGIGA